MYYETCWQRDIIEEAFDMPVSEITAIASEFGNSAKIIVPRS